MKCIFICIVIAHTVLSYSLRTPLTLLDDTNTKLLDSFLRKHLETLTLKRVNQTLTEKDQLEYQCIKQVNHTIDVCITCMHACGAAQAPVQYIPNAQIVSGGDELQQILKGLIKDPLGSTIDLVFDLGVGKLTDAVQHGIEHVAHEIGHGAEHVGKELVHGVEHLGKELNKGVEHLAHELSHGAEHVAHEIGNGVQHLGHELEHLAHGVEHTIHDLGHGIEHVGHQIEKGVHHIGHEISHIFGKRQKDCNAECPSCSTVNNSDASIVKNAVCGASYINKRAELISMVPKFKQIAVALQNRIIHKVEYDPASLEAATIQFKTVYVTANIKGTQERFRAKSSYQMMHMEMTATQWATGILDMFLV